jgi:hypothetical protein
MRIRRDNVMEKARNKKDKWSMKNKRLKYTQKGNKGTKG